MLLIQNLLKCSKQQLKYSISYQFFWQKQQKLQKNKDQDSKQQNIVNNDLQLKNISHLIEQLKEGLIKKKPIIPEKSREDKNKLTVVLEADELLYYVFSPDEHEAYMSQPLKDYDFCVYYQDYDTYLSIYKRPHLETFLKYLRENTEPILYTNGVKSYVDLVISLVDPDKTFKYIICQEEGSMRIKDDKENLDEYFKYLDILNRDMNKLLYFDSKPLQFWSNPENCVPVQEYMADSTINDNILLDVIQFLEEVKNEDDVRPICEQRFNIKQALIDTNMLNK